MRVPLAEPSFEQTASPPVPAALPSVLFATSEVAPLVKTGGLADVSASLPAALAAIGADVRLLLPGYPAILSGLCESRIEGRIGPSAGLPGATLLSGRINDRLHCLVVDCPEFYGRAGNPYVDGAGADWTDNPLRFGLLSKVAALLCGAASPIGWRPDVLHCNDWQTGLAPACLSFDRQAATAVAAAKATATVFTVHNLAFSGSFDPALLARLGLPPESFSMHGLEYHGQLSFLKAGLYYADCITTVSPTYAREIQQAPLGFGFQGLLAARSSRLYGILNGIDTAAWDPATDPCLAGRFTQDTLEARAANRRAVQQRFGLEPDDDAMLFGVVSRFTEQKGIDLILEAWPGLAARHRLQLAMLGSGDRRLTGAAAECVRQHPGRVGFIGGFDEPLSHLIEGGCDAFLMPSRFEPCGLNQMYSQRYGAPPLVRATGGLADSVLDDVSATATRGTGFVFTGDTSAALAATVARAFAAWQDRPRWRALQAAGMQRDFGWQASAASYVAVYRQAIAFATASGQATARSSSRVRTDA
jgi:starch synthase